MSNTIINKVAVGGMDALTDAEYDTLLRMPSTTRAIINKVAMSGFDGLSDSEYTVLRDNTRAPLRPLKPQANLETLSNARAALADFQPTTKSMLFPRLAAASDVDTARYAQPGLPQQIGAVTKDLLSLPSRTVLGGAIGLTGLSSVPGGEGSTLDRATQHMASEAGRSMSAATNLTNDPGLAGFLETASKDPLNALFPTLSLAGGVGRKIASTVAPKTTAAALEKLQALKPILTGAAGTEDAAQAADKVTHAAAQRELEQRVLEGVPHAEARKYDILPKFDAPAGPGDNIDFIDDLGVVGRDGPPTGGLSNAQGSGAALEGYLSAAERGAAAEIDPLASKILAGVHTPKKFTTLTPDWIAQKLGDLRASADNTSAASRTRDRVVAGVTNALLPTLNSVVRGGTPLVGYSTADALLSGDDREINPLTNLAAGAGLHGAGQALKAWGTKSFPGAAPAVATNRGPSKTVRQTVQQNMDELIGHGVLPTLTGESYKVAAEAKLADLGKKYGAASRRILPTEVVDPGEVLDIAKQRLSDLSQHGGNVYQGPVKVDADLLGTGGVPSVERTLRPEIQRVLDDGLASMQGNQHLFASAKGLQDPASIQGRGRDAVRARAEAKQALKEYQANVQAQLNKPALPANKLLDLRTEWNDPRIHTDPTGSVQLGKKHAYTALHDASNDVLERMRTTGGGTYGDILDKQDLRRQYALWSSFRDVLHSPRQGLQSRVIIPLLPKLTANAAVDNYWMPSAKYYAGRVTNRALGAGHALAQGLNDTTGAK